MSDWTTKKAKAFFFKKKNKKLKLKFDYTKEFTLIKLISSQMYKKVQILLGTRPPWAKLQKPSFYIFRQEGKKFKNENGKAYN